MAEYYEQYFPKTDFLTEDKMRFRDRESYFLHDFESRANLITYLSRHPSREKEEYARQLLARHKQKRNLQLTPSQVELRTSVLPARNYYEKAFGSYVDLCKALGFRSRFTSDEISVPAVPNDLEIWYDTREQTPLEFNVHTRRVKLDFGDYTASGAHYSGVFIERKSLPDFVNTLSQHFERFSSELDRASSVDAYMVVLVEAPIYQAMNFKIKQAKCSPMFIFKRLKDLMQKYDNLQFIFADNRLDASCLAKEILLAGEQVKNVDLQYSIERRQLCGKATRAIK